MESTGISHVNEEDRPEGEDPFEALAKKEEAIKKVAQRSDRIGALARILLTLSRDDRPNVEDLQTVGIPVGPIGEFSKNDRIE